MLGWKGGCSLQGRRLSPSNAQREMNACLAARRIYITF